MKLRNWRREFPLQGQLGRPKGGHRGFRICGRRNGLGSKLTVGIAIGMAIGSATPARADYTFSTLASFNWTNGATPADGVIIGANGNLYGTTTAGGTGDSSGGIFEFAASSRSLNLLDSFHDGPDDFFHTPAVSGLIADGNGNLFGTASSTLDSWSGTIFKYSDTTHRIDTAAIVGGDSGGNVPVTPLTADNAGNFIGATRFGVPGGGAIFQFSPATNSVTKLATLDLPTSGMLVSGRLLRDATGDVYGVARLGGSSLEGTVFKYAAVSHNIVVLASFDGSNGAEPEGGLVIDTAGNLYGTTRVGGGGAAGTVFKVDGVTHAISTLALLDGTGDAADGLIMNGAGNLFGTTRNGGANQLGSIFEIDATTHSFATLHSFTGTDGASPEGGLVMDSGGNLYGTTSLGGPDVTVNPDGTDNITGLNHFGTVFELSVPEPGSISLVTIGAVAALTRRRRNSQASV